MLRIIEVGTGYSPIPTKVGAATEIVIDELSNSFLNEGHKVWVVDLKNRQRGKTRLRFLEIALPRFLMRTTYTLGIMHRVKRVLYSLRIAGAVRSFLRNNDKVLPERIICHFHNQYNHFFFNMLAGRRLRKRLVTFYTLHSYIWSQPWEKIANIVNRKYFLEKSSLKNAGCIIALNEMARKNLENHLGIPREKIVLLPNGVNDLLYRPLEIDAALARLREEHAPGGERILLHVGSVCERKNQLGSVQTILPMLKEGKVRFLYAGGIIDRDYFERINSLVRSEGIEEGVRYLGELTPGQELNRYYNIADGFLFQSSSEAFGLVILEALSAGKPVFVSEKIKNRFFPKESSNGFIYLNGRNDCDTIRKHLFDDGFMKRSSVEGVDFIKANFSWGAIARKHLKLFENAVSKENF